MRLLFALLLVTSFCSSVANAATNEWSAVVFGTGATEHAWDADGPFTLGFKFRVNSPILITAMGVFDDGNDGLAVPHQVRLWTTSGTPLFTVAVPAGATAQLIDRFRYTPVAPISLPANTEFLIGAANFGQNADPYLAIAPTSRSSPRITLYDSYEVYTPSGNLVFPTRPGLYGMPVHFGANFRFAAVPEPSGFILTTIAACVVGIMRCQKTPQPGRKGAR